MSRPCSPRSAAASSTSSSSTAISPISRRTRRSFARYTAPISRTSRRCPPPPWCRCRAFLSRPFFSRSKRSQSCRRRRSSCGNDPRVHLLTRCVRLITLSRRPCPPKAAIARGDGHVRFVPKAAFALQQKAALFDHLVGESEQCRWDFEAERLRGFEIDHKLELGRVLYRQVARLGAVEEAAGILADQTVGF